jgi:hypothetical protein
LPLVAGDSDVILQVRAVDSIDLRQSIFKLQSTPGVLGAPRSLVFEDLDTR